MWQVQIGYSAFGSIVIKTSILTFRSNKVQFWCRNIWNNCGLDTLTQSFVRQNSKSIISQYANFKCWVCTYTCQRKYFDIRNIMAKHVDINHSAISKSVFISSFKVSLLSISSNMDCIGTRWFHSKYYLFIIKMIHSFVVSNLVQNMTKVCPSDLFSIKKDFTLSLS